MKNFEFEITSQSKKKAKRRREKGERKWLGFRITFIVTLIITIASVPLIIYGSKEDDEFLFELGAGLFSIFIMVCLSSRALLANMASHWIDSRLVERIWIKDGKMYHFIQVACGAGANSFSVDNSAYLRIMDLDSIFNARYDPKSGRIEFNVLGTGVSYTNYKKNEIRKTWDLTDKFIEVLYDYTKPSMYEYLKSIGVNFKEETINFKVVDRRV